MTKTSLTRGDPSTSARIRARVLLGRRSHGSTARARRAEPRGERPVGEEPHERVGERARRRPASTSRPVTPSSTGRGCRRRALPTTARPRQKRLDHDTRPSPSERDGSTSTATRRRAPRDLGRRELGAPTSTLPGRSATSGSTTSVRVPSPTIRRRALGDARRCAAPGVGEPVDVLVRARARRRRARPAAPAAASAGGSRNGSRSMNAGNDAAGSTPRVADEPGRVAEIVRTASARRRATSRVAQSPSGAHARARGRAVEPRRGAPVAVDLDDRPPRRCARACGRRGRERPRTAALGEDASAGTASAARARRGRERAEKARPSSRRTPRARRARTSGRRRAPARLADARTRTSSSSASASNFRSRDGVERQPIARAPDHEEPRWLHAPRSASDALHRAGAGHAARRVVATEGAAAARSARAARRRRRTRRSPPRAPSGSPGGTSRPFSPSSTTSGMPPTASRSRASRRERLDDGVREVLPRRGEERRVGRPEERSTSSRGCGPRKRDALVEPEARRHRARAPGRSGPSPSDEQPHVGDTGRGACRSRRRRAGAAAAGRLTAQKSLAPRARGAGPYP